jgi:hypothetical protein
MKYRWDDFLEEGQILYNYMTNNFENMFDGNQIKHFDIINEYYGNINYGEKIYNEYADDIQKELIDKFINTYTENIGKTSAVENNPITNIMKKNEAARKANKEQEAKEKQISEEIKIKKEQYKTEAEKNQMKENQRTQKEVSEKQTSRLFGAPIAENPSTSGTSLPSQIFAPKKVDEKSNEADNLTVVNPVEEPKK